MDFLAEFSEFKSLPNHTSATYIFFKAFSVPRDDNIIVWNSMKSTLDDQPLQEFRAFLKTIKRQLQENALSPSDCSRAMFFFYAKLLEHKCFSQETRQEILAWMEVCELVIS